MSENYKYMQYKLNESDYQQLWLVATPMEIAAEFGERAHHPRHIYKILQRFEASKVGKRRIALKKVLVECKPDFLSKNEAKDIAHDEIETMRRDYFRRMWKIVEDYEGRWN